MAEGIYTYEALAVPLNDASTIKLHSAAYDGLTVRYATAAEGRSANVGAASVSMLYGLYKNADTALTGTGRGVRGNASVTIASASGTVVGGEFRAANGTSTTSTDGVNLGAAYGVYALVAGVGQSGPAVLAKAYGVYAQLDIDAADLTVSDARGIYVNVQAGNASNSTLTLCNLAYFEYESVYGTAPAINSAIRIATVGGATGATSLIDATSFKLAVTDTDKVCLLKFTDANGTTKSMLYDTGTPALSFA